MRILHVSQPVEAGVANVVTGLVTHQRDGGHDVHVACPTGPGLSERVTLSGAAHHAWEAVRSPGATSYAEVRRLRRIVEAVDPDVVVLHAAKAGLAGRLVLRGRRPTVFAPHAWSFEAVVGAVATASTAWEVVAGRWTDAVVCVSEDECGRGRDVGMTGRMEIVPNGIDLDAWTPGPATTARLSLGLAERPTVVCVGRLAHQKGQDMLLAMWPSVLAAVPDAQLVLVGDGPDRAALESAAPPGVVFAGASDEVETFLAAADVVALPSRWEGMSLVSLEAMASARPVVAFAVGGVRSALGDTGAVLEPGDLARMAGALVRLLANPAEATAAGLAARERVALVADLRVGLVAWDDVLADVVRGAGAGAEPLRIESPTGVAALLAAGVVRSADVVSVAGDRRVDGPLAGVLSALGMPVWWLGDADRAPAALGAPVVSGPVEPEALARVARRPGAGTAGGPAVSIVVTVLNEGVELSRLVERLLPQLVEGDEIVIVDGGSTDGSLATVASDPALRIDVVPGAGISAGRNHGVRVARNEIIVCTDAGCVPDPGFVAGFRRAFAGAEPPDLVSGVYDVLASTAMERAQSLACYAQVSEVRRPGLLVRSYTRVFGTGYDPRFTVGRCMAFSRDAWKRVGGFPEHLATGEDVSFGLAIAADGVCLASTDALVGWQQRDGLAATWRMYRGYGHASTDGGNVALLLRDGARGLAYLVAPLLLTHPAARPFVAAGAAAYLSLPLVRAGRAKAGAGAMLLLPVALAVKDLGKIVGAAQGLARSRARIR